MQQTNPIPKCRLCSRDALHSITDTNNTGHICCIHYQKIFCKPAEYCIHNQPIKEITIDRGIIKGRRVTVTYQIRPEEEQKRIEETILRILARADQTNQLKNTNQPSKPEGQ